MRRRIQVIAIAAVSLAFMGGCTRGGRSPERANEEPPKEVPNTPPGSGQNGPGMNGRVNAVNGPNDSSGVTNTNGEIGTGHLGAHNESNRLPGTGNRP